MADFSKIPHQLVGAEFSRIKAKAFNAVQTPASRIAFETWTQWARRVAIGADDLKRLQMMWKVGKASGNAGLADFAGMVSEVRQVPKNEPVRSTVASRFTWTRQARADFLGIYEAANSNNTGAANRFYEAFDNELNKILGSAYWHRPEISMKARQHVVVTRETPLGKGWQGWGLPLFEGVYLILYEAHSETGEQPFEEFEIVRILNIVRELSPINIPLSD